MRVSCAYQFPQAARSPCDGWLVHISEGGVCRYTLQGIRVARVSQCRCTCVFWVTAAYHGCEFGTRYVRRGKFGPGTGRGAAAGSSRSPFVSWRGASRSLAMVRSVFASVGVGSVVLVVVRHATPIHDSHVRFVHLWLCRCCYCWKAFWGWRVPIVVSRH